MDKKMKQRDLTEAEIVDLVIKILGVSNSVPDTPYNKARRANNNAPLHIAAAKGEVSLRNLLERLQVNVRYLKFENEALCRERNRYHQSLMGEEDE